MSSLKIYLDFEKYNYHNEIVSDLSPIFNTSNENNIHFIISLKTKNDLLYSDFLMLVASSVYYLRETGRQVTGEIICDPNSPTTEYATRVDFFKWLNFKYEGVFNSKHGIGKFTELTPYNKENIKNIFDKILSVILLNAEIELDVQQMLHYCLYEILDNVLNHSDFPNLGNGKGWCCAQYFPNSKLIRLLICDNGVGIHRSLTGHPNSKHKNLSEHNALESCIQNGVTNSEGLGFGLFATSEFITLNKGEMMIYSGNHYVKIDGESKEIVNSDLWQGTFVYMKINTDQPVDYKLIMPEKHSLPNDYQHFIEEKFGFSNDLW